MNLFLHRNKLDVASNIDPLELNEYKRTGVQTFYMTEHTNYYGFRDGWMKHAHNINILLISLFMFLFRRIPNEYT